ncbi:hypothetical protein VTK73DRAFT_6742 [Phialemonium thermophilum]|uniref:Uncharacterized protein n=1 Tax=Phialemonium thermophilum TaxID=223376 RepID=A0ABR3WI69_9PEZI
MTMGKRGASCIPSYRAASKPGIQLCAFRNCQSHRARKNICVGPTLCLEPARFCSACQSVHPVRRRTPRGYPYGRSAIWRNILICHARAVLRPGLSFLAPTLILSAPGRSLCRLLLTNTLREIWRERDRLSTNAVPHERRNQIRSQEERGKPKRLRLCPLTDPVAGFWVQESILHTRASTLYWAVDPISVDWTVTMPHSLFRLPRVPGMTRFITRRHTFRSTLI